jgi:Uma2 family endonuclease
MHLSPDIAEQVLAAPTLALFTARANALLAREREARERFLEEVTPSQKAEFINGNVVMHSPARAKHLDATARLLTLMRAYANHHKLGWVTAEKLLVSLTRNDYEPDVTFYRAAVADTFAPDQMRFPAPDFACEVLSPSTEARDRGVKLEDYAAHGVREYWIVDAETETVEQYVLEARPIPESQTYALRLKSGSGTVESVAVDGFAIPVRALFDDDEQDAALWSFRDARG